MLGYWRRPEETAAAFRGEWFVTGDRARMDRDGAIAHLGRADDLMNAGGFRVSPAEVEAALVAHPDVAEAAVVEREVRPGVTRDRRLLRRGATARCRRPSSPPTAPAASPATNARARSTRSRRCRATATASCCAGR